MSAAMTFDVTIYMTYVCNRQLNHSVDFKVKLPFSFFRFRFEKAALEDAARNRIILHTVDRRGSFYIDECCAVSLSFVAFVEFVHFLFFFFTNFISKSIGRCFYNVLS